MGSLGRGQGLGLGQNNRVSIVVGRLIGKVTINQISNLAGYHRLNFYTTASMHPYLKYAATLCHQRRETSL